MADPRFAPEAIPMPFDGKRLIYGGFQKIGRILRRHYAKDHAICGLTSMLSAHTLFILSIFKMVAFLTSHVMVIQRLNWKVKYTML